MSSLIHRDGALDRSSAIEEVGCSPRAPAIGLRQQSMAVLRRFHPSPGRRMPVLGRSLFVVGSAVHLTPCREAKDIHVSCLSMPHVRVVENFREGERHFPLRRTSLWPRCLIPCMVELSYSLRVVTGLGTVATRRLPRAVPLSCGCSRRSLRLLQGGQDPNPCVCGVVVFYQRSCQRSKMSVKKLIASHSSSPALVASRSSCPVCRSGTFFQPFLVRVSCLLRHSAGLPFSLHLMRIYLLLDCQVRFCLFHPFLLHQE